MKDEKDTAIGDPAKELGIGDIAEAAVGNQDDKASEKTTPTMIAPTAWVRKTYPEKRGKPDEYEEEVLEVKLFITEPAVVKAGAGMTINIGNYESLRVDAGVELPCYAEEVEEAHRQAFKMTEAILFAKVEETKRNM